MEIKKNSNQHLIFENAKTMKLILNEDIKKTDKLNSNIKIYEELSKFMEIKKKTKLN